MTQNACLLPAQYGSTLDPALMAADPLYALSELFNFVASSESQFLNLLQFQIEKDILFQPENMEQPVANLKHSKTLLDEHLQYLRNTLEVLRNPTMLDRHKTKQQGKESVDAALQDGNDLIDAALQDLVLDYQHLLSRAESLATQCLGGTNIIMNAAMLKEARKSITQTEIITRLTYLAFFFVPLSFTASLFGMNFKQLGTGILDIWWMFVVLVPLVLFSFAVSSWDSIVRVVRRGRNKTSDPTK
jgi:Mg2+ and Co2+ transporter CorA